MQSHDSPLLHETKAKLLATKKRRPHGPPFCLTTRTQYCGCADCSGVGGVWLVGGVPLGVLGLALVGTEPLGCTGAACPVGDALPFPVTVMRSTTLRLPAYDCAMRSAVCFSFPVETVPESSMVESVTFTLTLLLESRGSLLNFSWMVLCRLEESLDAGWSLAGKLL